MANLSSSMLAVLGTLLVAIVAQATPADGPQAGSNGPNMPRSSDIVPSEIRPQEPAATGTVRELDNRSRWEGVHRPTIREPSR